MPSDYLDLVKELMAPLGRVSARAMFGGHGVYVDGAFVAIVWKNQVYLKADSETRPRFEEQGLTPFRPSAKAEYSLSFYAPPEEALEDPEAFREWGDLAFGAARRALRAKRPPVKPRGLKRRNRT